MHHLSLEFSAASSALEMALCDVSGKLLNAPLCKFLGDDYHRATLIYGNIWSAKYWNDASLKKRATDLVTQGYRTIKIHPMLNLMAQDAANCVN